MTPGSGAGRGSCAIGGAESPLHEHPATIRGVRYLLDEQLPDGTWDEPEFTGTGFPQVFYLRYHMYPTYFPLMALSRWALAAGRTAPELCAANER